MIFIKDDVFNNKKQTDITCGTVFIAFKKLHLVAYDTILERWQVVDLDSGYSSGYSGGTDLYSKYGYADDFEIIDVVIARK